MTRPYELCLCGHAEDRHASEGAHACSQCVCLAFSDYGQRSMRPDPQVATALRWVIEHKSCTGFEQCWAAAPPAVREAIVEAWGEDPWFPAVPDYAPEELS